MVQSTKNSLLEASLFLHVLFKEQRKIAHEQLNLVEHAEERDREVQSPFL
jgi:hypothetical protein